MKVDILGSDSGNGDNLSRFILEHYNSLLPRHTHAHQVDGNGVEDGQGGGGQEDAERPKHPLLFLTGEQHRDVIPKTLTDPALPRSRQIPVRELVVYEAGIKAGLEHDLARTLQEETVSGGQEERDGALWVVLFSPGSCAAVLASLRGVGMRFGAGDSAGGGDGRKVYIATIGSTTRDHLRANFGVEADVCAERPSPEGLWAGIQDVMDRLDRLDR